MKPVLKSYVGFGTSDGGVFFEAGQRSFELKGPKLFPLVSRLLRTLDGTRTIDAILEALPPALRPLFRTLVSELDRNGMLQFASADDLRAIPSEIATRYRTTLAFLQDESPAGVAHFLTWRTQPIAVAGAGHSHRALVHGLIGSGAGTLFMIGEMAGPVEQLLAEHAAADPGFVWRRIDALDEAPAAARLLLAADDLADLSIAQPILARSTVLAGGVYRARGLVGPCVGGPSKAWSTLRPLGASLPFPESTLGVIGALVAFEALKGLLYAERVTPGDLRWDETHLFTITPGADIAVHPINVASPTVRPSASMSDAAPPADAAADPGLDRPFDPATGPFEWQEPGGREFPLPRRAILVRFPDGREERVSHWALTPQQLDLRVVCKAAAALAGMDAQAAPDPVTWRELALADAIARSSAFAQATSVDLDPAGETDPALQMLIRLARLYGDAMPQLRVAYLPGAPAFLAEASVGGITGRAAHGTAVLALVEALGDAISYHQGGEGAPVRSRYAPLAEPIGRARRVADLCTGAERRCEPAYVPEILTPGYLVGTGIVVGRMVREHRH